MRQGAKRRIDFTITTGSQSSFGFYFLSYIKAFWCVWVFVILMSEFAITKSKRGGNVLTLNGHEYIFHKNFKNGSILWRCRKYVTYKCSATITTRNEQIETQPRDHLHSGDKLNIQRNQVLAEIYGAATATSVFTRNVLGEHMRNLNEDVMSRIPKRN
jgi:hypothetical protein